MQFFLTIAGITNEETDNRSVVLMLKTGLSINQSPLLHLPGEPKHGF